MTIRKKKSQDSILFKVKQYLKKRKDVKFKEYNNFLRVYINKGSSFIDFFYDELSLDEVKEVLDKKEI